MTTDGVSQLIEKAAKENAKELRLQGLISSPSDIDKLEHLEKLRANLEKLDLSDNELDEFPHVIVKLKNLTTLDLSGNKLKSLPDDVKELTNLTTLNLSKNKLNEFPPVIIKLTKLKKLNYSSNELDSLPHGIEKLTNLTELNLYGNRLEWKSLPKQITKLTNLTTLNLRENHLQPAPPGLREQDPKAIFDFLKGQIAELKKQEPIVEQESLTADNEESASKSLTKVPYENVVSQVVAKIKNEPFLFVIAIVALLIGLAVLAAKLSSPDLRFVIVIITFLAFIVIFGYYVLKGLQEWLKYKERSQKITSSQTHKATKTNTSILKQQHQRIAPEQDGDKYQKLFPDVKQQSVSEPIVPKSALNSQLQMQEVAPPASMALSNNVRYDTANIRKLLTEAIGDEELDALCMDYFPEVHKQFSSGMSRPQKMQRLIEYCARHNKFTYLLDLVKEANPSKFADYEKVVAKRKE